MSPAYGVADRRSDHPAKPAISNSRRLRSRGSRPAWAYGRGEESSGSCARSGSPRQELLHRMRPDRVAAFQVATTATHPATQVSHSGRICARSAPSKGAFWT